MQEKGFVVGGGKYEGPYDSGYNAVTEISDLDTKEWKIMTNFETSIINYAAASLNTVVFIFGGQLAVRTSCCTRHCGCTTYYEATNNVYVYENNQYYVTGYLNTARSNHNILSIGNMAYIIGNSDR